LVVSFLDEQELKNEIRHLKEYRSNGLTKLQHIKMFRLLKKNREKERGDRHLLQDVISHIRVCFHYFIFPAGEQVSIF
jgi:hypothetical protein